MSRTNKGIVIGGEHIFNYPLADQPITNGYFSSLTHSIDSDYHSYFTFGGYYSLLAIADYLQNKYGNDCNVLFPSYLCPSMLKPFDLHGINYRFYRVDNNLYVNAKHLLSIVDQNTKAVLFIDYFGASQKSRIDSAIEFLRLKSIHIIQDVVQCLDLQQTSLFGDFVFNSFRKFLPVEGSLLLSKIPLNIHFTRKNFSSVYYKRAGQFLRKLDIDTGLMPSRPFLWALRTFEANYYHPVVYRMSRKSYNFINSINFDKLIEHQSRAYQHLKTFQKVGAPELLIKQDNSFTPLGLVLKINNRDRFREYLFRNNIYAPIHWKLALQIDPSVFKQSWELSETLITIPMINLSEEKVNYLFSKLFYYFENHESIS